MNFDGEPLDTDVRMQTKKQKPTHEVRLGLIKAAVWKNETESGVRYNTTFSRIYKKEWCPTRMRKDRGHDPAQRSREACPRVVILRVARTLFSYKNHMAVRRAFGFES